MKNILLLNAGTRNILVRDFKKTIAGNASVIATDNYFLAPALYEADKYYITPWITDIEYWDRVEEICIKEDVGLIVSLIDPELELLAKEKERFQKLDILLNTNEYDIIKNTFNKTNTINFLKNHSYPCIATYTSIEDAISAERRKEIDYPLFIKPACGSGSSGISYVNNELELRSRFKEGFIVQQYMDAQEIGVDVYIDLISGELVSIFAKKKLKMRAGETDKSVSYKNEKLFHEIERFAKEFGLKGVNDIDVFEKDGDFYISEVNPRFGGGYLHAYECGVDFPQMLINNMNGIVNERNVGEYKDGVYMMKYFDVKMLDNN